MDHQHLQKNRSRSTSSSLLDEENDVPATSAHTAVSVSVSRSRDEAFVRQVAAALQEHTTTKRTTTHSSSPSSASSSGHHDVNSDNVAGAAALELWRELHFDQPQWRRWCGKGHCATRLSEFLLQQPSRAVLPPHNLHPPQPQSHILHQHPSLTPRFVRGLQQALQQQQQPKPSDTTNTNDGADTDPNTTLLLRPDQSTGSSYSSSSSSGLAHLAYTVHGKIPLHILAYHVSASQLLGTFRGSPIVVVDDQKGTEMVVMAEAEGNGNHHHRDDDDDDAAVGALVDAWSSSSQRQGSDNGHVDDSDNGCRRSLDDEEEEEVWADESDPSDYSYGDTAADGVDAVATAFNIDNEGEEDDVEGLRSEMASSWPLLPHPMDDNPWTALAAAKALTALLDQLQYRDVASLRPWTSKIDDELTQLALTLLLVPTTTASTTSSSTETEATDDPHPPAIDASAILRSLPPRHWQKLAIRPIHVLRDAAAESVEPEGIDTPSRLSAYLQLLQSMLQVHRILGPPPSTPGANGSPALLLPATTIPPATWLALALLADECDTCRTAMRPGSTALLRPPQQRRLEAVQGVVVGSVDDLVLVLEGAMAESQTHDRLVSSSPTTIEAEEELGERVLDGAVALLVPIVRVLCLPHLFTGSTMENASSGLAAAPAASKPSQQSFQMLLNSGLYRQLLLSWQQLKSEFYCASEPSDAHLNQDLSSPPRARNGSALLHTVETAVLELSVASPKLLGKYTWRFPGLAASLARLPLPEDTECSLQQVVEWNLLGTVLSSTDVAAPVVHWKARPGSATSDPPPTGIACQAAARTGIQVVLQRLVGLVDLWKEQRLDGAVDPDPSTSSSREPTSQRELQQEQQKHQQWLTEFQDLVERLTHWPLLTQALGQLKGLLIEGSDGPFSLRETLQPLQKALSTWPSRRALKANDRRKVSWESQSKKWDDVRGGEAASNALEAMPPAPSPPAPTNATTDNDGTVVPLWKQGAQDAAVDALRRSVKTLSSLCDDFDAAAKGSGGSMTKASSKAD